MVILERVLSKIRDVAATFLDERTGRVKYSMSDIAMSGLALFVMQCESFLEFQRQLEEEKNESNCKTLFGIKAIPTDERIRQVLDLVPPSALQPCFDAVLAELQAENGLSAFQRLDGRTLIALDGTEYFCSQKIQCDQCLTRKRSNGTTEHYHAMLAATIVAPGHKMVFTLMPEFIVKQDGAEKQDCERNAAKRWLATHGERFRPLRPVYLGDALFACQPICEAVLKTGSDFLFTAKPTSHITLYDFMKGATCEEKSLIRKIGGKKRKHRFRWFKGAPLRDGKTALTVNWLNLTIFDPEGKKQTYSCDFLTSLDVNEQNVADIADCARTRWKIENEGFNVLKNHGYHLEHNFGHGEKHLATVFATMNLLAFAMHTLCDCVEDLWIKARNALGARRLFFERIRNFTVLLVFPSWWHLMTTIAPGRPP